MQHAPRRARAPCRATPPIRRRDCEATGYAAGSESQESGTDFVLTCDSSWAIGSDVTVSASYPYDVSLLGWVVASGQLNTTMKERVE